MKYYMVSEMATRWGITVSLVRRYCREGKIPGAQQTEYGWQIPMDAVRPGAVPISVRMTPKSALVKRLEYDLELFIIDDKHRAAYNRGIAQWDEDQTILLDPIRKAQTRFRNVSVKPDGKRKT